MHNQWLQLGWFVLLTAAWLCAGGVQVFAEGLRRDAWLSCVCGLAFLMLVRSSILDSPGMTISDLWMGWIKTGGLVVMLLVFWQVARSPRVIQRMGLPMVGIAALAAGVSLVVFYVLDPEGMFGLRLKNWFVYGGLNSVCTGLTFGFAAIWAAACWNMAAGKKERRIWFIAMVPLLAGTLFTLSRGALLALVLSHASLFICCGWRRAWKPLLVLGMAIGLFQAGGPLMSALAVNSAAKRLGVEDHAVAARMIGDSVVSANPMSAMLERADNGRGIIFQAGLKSMSTWQDWAFGKGMWSANDFWSCSLPWYPEHLHSIFMDAFVRGGLPGILGLLFVIGWGCRRAVILARQGEELWLMLACFGIAGLMFDGDSAFALLTVPRYEPLILWVPLVMASSRLMAQQQQQQQQLLTGPETRPA